MSVGKNTFARVAAALIGGVALGFALPTVAGGEATPQILTENAHLPDPALSMQYAEETTRYDVKTPRDIPPGAEIRLVETLQDPDNRYVNVDIWWETEDGRRFHLWQTDASPDMFARSGMDPAASTEGEPAVIQGRTWRMVRFSWGEDAGVSLNYRFDDGITVSLDALLADFTLDELTTIAGSIR